MAKDPLTVAEVAHRSGFAPSALRFYEEKGLIEASRTSGGQRRYARAVLRRLAFVRAASNVGLSLDEIAAELDTLPHGRTPNSRGLAAHLRGLAGPPRRADRRDRGAARPARRVHRLRLPLAADLLALQPRGRHRHPDLGAGRLPELLRRPGARERETAGSPRGLPGSVVAGG